MHDDTCPKCNAVVTADYRRCPVCKFLLAEVAEVEPQPRRDRSEREAIRDAAWVFWFLRKFFELVLCLIALYVLFVLLAAVLG